MGLSVNLFKLHVSLQSQFRTIQLERSNISAGTQSRVACKKYVEIPLSTGETAARKKYVEFPVSGGACGYAYHYECCQIKYSKKLSLKWRSRFVFLMLSKKGKSEFFTFQSIILNPQYLFMLIQFQRCHVYAWKHFFIYSNLLANKDNLNDWQFAWKKLSCKNL